MKYKVMYEAKLYILIHIDKHIFNSRGSRERYIKDKFKGS